MTSLQLCVVSIAMTHDQQMHPMAIWAVTVLYTSVVTVRGDIDPWCFAVAHSTCSGGGDQEPCYNSSHFTVARMQKGMVFLTMQALGHHHNCISVPPPLWNVPLQSIMDGHLSCSSCGHGMHLLIITITCVIGNTHNLKLQASHVMTEMLLHQQCSFHSNELYYYTINGYSITTNVPLW